MPLDNLSTTDIFISYRRSRREVVERVAAALRAHGWTVWFDVQITGGARFRREIEVELGQSRCALALWCDESIESDFVLDEAGWAAAQGALVQARWMDVAPPLGFGQQQQIDIIGWQHGLPELLPLIQAIERLIGPPGQPKRAPMGKPKHQRIARSNGAPTQLAKRSSRAQRTPTPNASTDLQSSLKAMAFEHERFDLHKVDPRVRSAVEEARAAELAAIAAQHKALRAAERAEDASRAAYRGEQGHDVLEIEWSDGENGGEFATQIQAERRNGHGIFRITKGVLKGERYAGQFKDGFECGVGVLEYAHRRDRRTRYDGEFANARPNGHGSISWRDGRKYAGTVRDGKATGLGSFRSKNGDRYEGMFGPEAFDGYGVLWTASGSVKAQGVWTHGVLSARLGGDIVSKALDFVNELARRMA